MSNKKTKKSTNSNSSSPIVTPNSMTIMSEMKVKVLFQGKKKTLDVHNDSVVMNSKDMKAIGVKAGSYISIDNAKCPIIVCRVWSSPNAVQGSVIMNRFWYYNGFDKEERQCIIKNMIGSLSLHGCVSAEFLQISGQLVDVSNDKLFSTYFYSMMCDVSISIGHVIQLYWKTESLLFQLINVKTTIQLNTSDSIFYITRCTSLSFNPKNLSTISEPHISYTNTRIALNDYTSNFWNGINSKFGGYKHQVKEVVDTVQSAICGGNINTERIDSSTVSLMFKPPRGLLLYGPRGTGKTLLLHTIADAFKMNIPMLQVYTIKHDILLFRYQGEAEAEITRIFTEAAKNSPSIILMDDVDLICKHRSSQSTELQNRIVSCILTLVDGLSQQTDSFSQQTKPLVFILAASCKPNDIEQAMRRPGRLDKEIELTVPTVHDRSEILRTILRTTGDLKLDANSEEIGVSESSIAEVARKAHGMVASDILLVCKEAHMNALDRNLSSSIHISQNSTDMTDLEQSFDRLAVAGSSPRYIEPDDSRMLRACCGPLIDEDLLTAVDRIVPSAIREVAVDIAEVRWNDIGGMDSVKQSLKEVVEWPLHHPELFIKMGISPPSGVLLYGPPGCSKTLMAKALATESGLNFLAVRGPELLSKWLGDSEKAVQTLFRRARSAAPCLIFFDEIDAFASKRGESSSGVNDRVMSQMLTEIDGFHDNSRVIVVAATNRPDMLDPALLRPGRIDRKIYVPPPDYHSRHQILSINLKKMPLAQDVDINLIAEYTNGFSGAELVAICSESALLAIDSNCDAVCQEHLLKSISDLKPQITPEMLEYYANIANTLFK